MPALSVTELPSQSGTFTKSLDGRKLRRVFDIYMDSNTAGPNEAVAEVEALGVVFDSEHPTYTISTLDYYDSEQLSDRRNHWKVTAYYVTRVIVAQQTNDTNRDPSQPDPEFRDPLNEPAVEAWSSQLLQVGIQKDVSGNAIVNYAKRPYEPPPTDWQAVAVFNKQHNVAAFVPADISGFVNRVNSIAFEGFNARQCICMSITAERRWRQWRVDASSAFQTTEYWAVSTEIHCIDNADDPDPIDAAIGPWDLYLLQQDIMELDSTTGEPVEIMDDNGMPVREPQPIDESGKLVPAASRPGGIVFRGHAIKKTADLNLI